MVTKEGIDQSPVDIGHRVSCDGENGTVLFVGEIESQDGQWFGVEWDNPSRGKHSGTYKGITYFQTSVENAGSFIRPWKAETGISCPEAVRRKYGEGYKANGAAETFSLPQHSGKIRVVEMVGFNKVAGKQSQFERLTEVVVSSMQVSTPGSPGELEELAPNVNILDLSCNLLRSWADIAAITEQLVSLRCLVLSKNRLKIENDMMRYKECFEGLETVVLNGMNYSWNDVLRCAVSWPSVKKLFTCSNQITSLEVPVQPVFSDLRSLSLQGNLIQSWQEVNKLGGLVCLEELYLDDNQLEFISFENVPPMEKTVLFPRLTSLSIRNNCLSKWRDISELSKLSNLLDLKVMNNPILNSVNPETARQMVIAKILSLQSLNRSEIERGERKGAETDYIKKFHMDWIANGGHRDLKICHPSVEFLAEHPSYIMLLQRHGAAEDSEVTVPRALLKNNLISVELHTLQVLNRPSVVKKLPVTMLICKVKALVRRLFNIPVQNEIKMMCYRVDGDGKGVEMDNDLREIGYYLASDGDRIEVSW